MLKILNSLYYFFLCGTIKTYHTSKKLDILLIYLKEVGIKSIVKESKFYSIIIFNDGSRLRFWNENRWYAWMSEGSIYFNGGKHFTWENEMPRNEVLYKFKKAVELHEKKNINNDNYSEFLPQKILRKMKLKKLKK